MLHEENCMANMARFCLVAMAAMTFAVVAAPAASAFYAAPDDCSTWTGGGLHTSSGDVKVCCVIVVQPGVIGGACVLRDR
jgi:hypothetical protein